MPEIIQPFIQILRSMADMSVQGQEHISIFDLTEDGNATFSVPLEHLGLTPERVNHVCNFRSRTFINFLGELLIRPRFREFYEILITLNNYSNEMSATFQHQDFGLKLKRDPDVLEFTFHISLLQELEQEQKTQEIAGGKDIEMLLVKRKS